MRKVNGQSDGSKWMGAMSTVGIKRDDGVDEVLDRWDEDCRELLDTRTVEIGILCVLKMIA